MEHPDVIREIDALIDSYNWEGVTDEPEKIANSIKQSLRLNKCKVYAWNASQPTHFLIFQILMKTLQHPHVQHRGWVLQAIYHSSYIPFDEPPQAIGIRRYRALQDAIPLLRRYMRHHKPFYRRWAAMTLSRLTYQPDQIVRCFLDHLQSEKSLHVKFHIFNRIADLYENRHGQLIQPQTQAKVLLYLETSLKSKDLLVRIYTATLFMRIMQRSTPVHVIKVIIESWPHLDGRRETHWRAAGYLIDWIGVLGTVKRVDLWSVLLKNSKEFIVALELWERIAEDQFLYYRGERRIAFSGEEKLLLEALLLCKPLWRIRRVAVPEWLHRTAYHFNLEYQGLEHTREGLRRQLRHARTIDHDLEGRRQFQDLPLQLERDISD